MRSAHKQKNPTISNVKSLDFWSEWRESNSRPLEPHSSALPKLRYTRTSDRACRSQLNQYTRRMVFCQALFSNFFFIDKSITKFNKFSPDFLCILAQHKQAVKFCFLAASFIRSVLPILSSRPAFPAMRSLSYIMVTLLFVMRSAPVPAGIGGTLSPHSYTRESSGGSC